VLAQGVHLDQTGIYRAFKSSEFGYETNLALVDGFEWVGAADAAGDGTAETDAFSQAVD
jgi:hypothetical protein